MKTNARVSRRRRVGIAIAADAVFVAPLSEGRHRKKSFPAWSAPLSKSLLDAAADAADTISAALSDCPHLSRDEPALAYVVLLPPLALGRRITLPRLTESEYRQVISRDSFRYFATDRSPRVVGVLPLPGNRASPVPVFACSAPAVLVEAIRTAVTATGCEVASLDCAYASWAGAATAIWPSLARSKSAIIVCQDDVTEIIYSQGNGPEVVRRVRSDAPANQLLDAVGMYANGGPPRTCAILGSTERYNEWGSRLSEVGIAVMPSTPASRLGGGALSAMYAAVGRGPGLYPEPMYTASRAASHRLAARLGAIAAALLIVSAALVLWGVKRELRTVVAERDAIRSDVAQALTFRSDITGLDSRSAMIASLASAAPRWSAVLSSIAQALPDDAHLSSIQARADTIVLEGTAARAAGVFQALQADRDLSAVHSTAPVRQQLQDGSPVERFTVAARLAPPPPRTDK